MPSSISGELCTAGSRLLVEKSVHERVLAGVVAATKAFKVGDPLDPATQMGPLITAEHMKLVSGYIEKGDAEGGKRLCGGPRSESGYYVDPDSDWNRWGDMHGVGYPYASEWWPLNVWVQPYCTLYGQ